jgi:hypothetical protein
MATALVVSRDRAALGAASWMTSTSQGMTSCPSFLRRPMFLYMRLVSAQSGFWSRLSQQPNQCSSCDCRGHQTDYG